MKNRLWYDNCITPLSTLTQACNKLYDDGWTVIAVSFSGMIGRARPSVLMPQKAEEQVPMMVVVASKMGSEDQPETIAPGSL